MKPRKIYLVRVEGGQWRVLIDMEYRIDEFVFVTVPAGRVTDFASLPRVARLFVRNRAAHSWSSVFHDELYSHVKSRKLRVLADAIWWQAMGEDEDVNRYERIAMWLAVRLFGWWTYYFGQAAQRAAHC